MARALKILTKDMLLRAMKFTKSNRAAAKYLGCSYNHFKPYMQMYLADDGTGRTLFDVHYNQTGKGIAKWNAKNKRGSLNVKRIVETNVGWSSYTPAQIKNQLLQEGYLMDECYNCGFRERRVTDYKIPLLLTFKDNNKANYLLENLELNCYNCYFLHIADPLSQDQTQRIEDNQEVRVIPHKWDTSPEAVKNMRLLGII
jgi:hypothetical protein